MVLAIALLNPDLSFFENTVDPSQLMKPADQDPHCFPLWLKIHTYDWNVPG